MARLKGESVSCSQSVVDADYLTANTTILKAGSMQSPVVLVVNDTDLLVMFMLIHGSKTKNVYMQYAGDYIYNVHSIVQNLNSPIATYV